MIKEIFIPGNVPSSKNSKQWTGKFLVHSKQAQKYYKATDSFWKAGAIDFNNQLKQHAFSKPLKVSFTFIRGTKHKFDYVNPLQTILDLMVKHGWIEDDNADEIIPVFETYSYDKVKPGVKIKLI